MLKSWARGLGYCRKNGGLRRFAAMGTEVCYAEILLKKSVDWLPKP